MSPHRVDVVRLGPITKHDNADTLGLVKVFGWQCVVRLSDWHEGDLAAYCPPDSLVDTRRTEFAFLHREGRDHERIKVRRLRGQWSEGLLVPAPEGLCEGDDAVEALAVGHYEPPAQGTACDAEAAPPGVIPIYDVENFRRYPDVFGPDEAVVVTEKIHGTNARFFYDDARFWCGSHRQWKKDGDNVYWRALRGCPALMEYLQAHPAIVAYGEAYGWVSELRYGRQPNQVSVALFDLWDRADRVWLAWDECVEAMRSQNLPWVPILGEGARGRLDLEALAEGTTQAGGGRVREGVVVRPAEERTDDRLAALHGRVLLKVVGRGYLDS